MSRPTLIIDPAIQFGRPTVTETRITTDAVFERVAAGEPVAEVADDYEITRADVILCCWYEFRHIAETAPSRRTRFEADVFAAWDSWWLPAHKGLAGWSGAGPLLDPPEVVKDSARSRSRRQA